MERGEEQPADQRRFIFVKFNAWEFVGSEVLWAALICKIFEAVSTWWKKYSLSQLDMRVKFGRIPRLSSDRGFVNRAGSIRTSLGSWCHSIPRHTVKRHEPYIAKVCFGCAPRDLSKKCSSWVRQVEGHYAFGPRVVRAARVTALLKSPSWSWCGLVVFYFMIAVVGTVVLAVITTTGVVDDVELTVELLLALLGIPGILTLVNFLYQVGTVDVSWLGQCNLTQVEEIDGHVWLRNAHSVRPHMHSSHCPSVCDSVYMMGSVLTCVGKCLTDSLTGIRGHGSTPVERSGFTYGERGDNLPRFHGRGQGRAGGMNKLKRCSREVRIVAPFNTEGMEKGEHFFYVFFTCLPGGTLGVMKHAAIRAAPPQFPQRDSLKKRCRVMKRPIKLLARCWS